LPGKIGRFQIEQFLGEGAFGKVYRACDPSLKRQVALKVAKPEQMHSPERIERFQREAQAAAPLTHNHIVAVYDHGQDGPHHYLATAFVPGLSLERVLQELPEGQTLPLTQAVQIVRKLAEALAYAHQQKVTHRDVKPANVMLRQDGEPLLMDFGLAARAEGEQKLTQAGVVLGTPEFMAPEQWQGKAQPASDQYSLGCLFFELLTGRLPFSGGSPGHYLFLHAHEPAPSPRKFNPRLPRDLETICLKCLEKEPSRRYADCQELADDLRRYLVGRSGHGPPPSGTGWQNGRTANPRSLPSPQRPS
jgi:serine/threonine protein kinase